VSHLAPEQRFTLRKDERMCSKKAFSHLFEHGKSIRIGVLKIFFVLDPPEDLATSQVMVAFTASKRSFKRAVDRNYLKRRMREAYRLHRPLLSNTLEDRGTRMLLLFSYQARQRADYDRIRRSMVRALHTLKDQLPPIEDSLTDENP